MFNPANPDYASSNPALTTAIRRRRFQPNNAPQGFGQPNGSGFADTTADPNPEAPESVVRPPQPGPQNTGINGGAAPGGLTGGGPTPPPAPPPPKPTAPPPGAGSGKLMPTLTADMNPEQTHQAVQDYYAQRGVTPLGARGATPGSVDYWTQKAPELIARGKELDPSSDGTAYLNKFLSNAEEFTGSPEATAAAMGWGPQGGGAAPNPHAGMNTFNNPTLKRSILPGATSDPGFFTNQSALSRIQALMGQLPKIGGAR